MGYRTFYLCLRYKKLTHVLYCVRMYERIYRNLEHPECFTKKK